MEDLPEDPDPGSGDDNEGNDSDNSSDENSGRDRNLSYDRGDRNLNLEGDKFVKELDRLFNDFKDWANDNGFTTKESTGNKEKSTKRSDFDLLSDDKPNELSKWGLTKYHDWIDIAFFAIKNGFNPTSTIGGTHNIGSLHGSGAAVDVSVRDKTNQQIEKFIEDATKAGFKVRDERLHPAGQAVWGGPHIHLSVPHVVQKDKLKASNNINKDINTIKEKQPTHEINIHDQGWGSNLLKIPLL